MIRANQKAPIETVAGISIACDVETCSEVSRSPDATEARVAWLDEVGIA
jgi:hypothetical protein